MNNLFLRHGEVNNPKNIHYSNLPGFSLSTTGNFQAKSIGEKIKKNFEIKKLSPPHFYEQDKLHN